MCSAIRDMGLSQGFISSDTKHMELSLYLINLCAPNLKADFDLSSQSPVILFLILSFLGVFIESGGIIVV